MAISTSGVSVPQLGQTVDPSIYKNQQAPQGMTLADLVNVSRGNVALQKEKALLEPSIQQGEAQARQATTQADTAQLENNIKHATVATQNIQQLLTKPDLKSNDIVEMVKKTADTHGGSPQSVQQALIGLPQNGSQAALKAWLAQKLAASTGALAQFEALNPAPTSVGGVPGFANRLNQTFTPINTPTNAPPTSGETTSGTTGTGGTTTQPTEPQKIVQETFPNRSNTSYVSDTEKPKFEEGVKLLAEGKQIGDAAQTQLNDIRNARKYIKSASGTALGQGSRSLAKLVVENPDLDSLIKSTAQLQMNAATRFGASTDAARETAAAAAGGADISEKALVRILDNAEADLTRDARYSAGLQKFVQKRGNTGGTLNASDFKQAWINNAKDRKLYQLININANPELSTAQKQIMRDELLQHENPSTIKALEKQLKAMKQLEKGD